MRYRTVAARDAVPIGPPSSPDERRLEQVQTRLTAAEQNVSRLTAERDALAMRLWLSDAMPQAEIAERLDRADRRAGGEGITYAALQKRVWRRRNEKLASAG